MYGIGYQLHNSALPFLLRGSGKFVVRFSCQPLRGADKAWQLVLWPGLVLLSLLGRGSQGDIARPT